MVERGVGWSGIMRMVKSSKSLELFKQRSENLVIDFLNGSDLVLDFSSVAALVGSLHMNINIVLTVFEFIESGLHFSL